MKTAIFTGFHRFGHYAANPTEKLARLIDCKIVSGHYTRSHVFSASIHPLDVNNHGFIVVSSAILSQASAIISFGLSSNVRGIRIESSCDNWIANEKYCAPEENNKPVDLRREPKEKIKTDLNFWNVGKIFEAFQKNGIPFEPEISSNAENFCCNALMYRILCVMDELNIRLPFLFCHVPCTEEAIASIPDFDRENKALITDGQLLKTVEILLGSYESRK